MTTNNTPTGGVEFHVPNNDVQAGYVAYDARVLPQGERTPGGGDLPSIFRGDCLSVQWSAVEWQRVEVESL